MTLLGVIRTNNASSSITPQPRLQLKFQVDSMKSGSGSLGPQPEGPSSMGRYLTGLQTQSPTAGTMLLTAVLHITQKAFEPFGST